MSKYLFIESRDPFELTDVRELYVLAQSLSGQGHDVTFYLVQNGVLAARSGIKNGDFAKLTGGSIKVLADDFSLGERGIESGDVTSGVQVSNMDELVDLIVEGDSKVVWH